MTTTRAAKYLNGSDLGKTISYAECDEGTGAAVTFTGRLVKADHALTIIEETTLCDPEPTYALGSPTLRIELVSAGTFIARFLTPNHPVTVEGTDTPPGLNLHRPVTGQDG